MSTIRQAIISLLKEQELSARDLSQVIGIREKEVYEHLTHIARSAAVKGKLRVVPAACRACGFAFRKRDRLTPPGRCFQCRSESIDPPRFQIRE
jgi:predicted Zn-ribbon and HTH transcriptional regulator